MIDFFEKFNSPQIELLKWIAIITMVIDHVGMLMFPEAEHLRTIGRFTFPIFSFILVHNYLYFTSNKEKFIQRLFIFSIISQPFYMLIYGWKFNIFLLLSFSLLFINRLEYIGSYKSIRSYFSSMKNYLNSLLILSMSVMIYFLNGHVDYGLLGFLLILSIYLNFKHLAWLPFFLFILICLNLNSMIAQMYATLFVVPLLLTVKNLNSINIKRTSSMFFYIFYPAHFFALFLILRLI